jgi:hypothetical protein
MPEPFPHFEGPHSIPTGGSWSAEFESYDMRMDTAYYYVTCTRADGDVSQFFVRVHVSGGVPDPEELLRQVSRHAEQGQGNTDYTGSMMWKLRRKKAATRSD